MSEDDDGWGSTGTDASDWGTGGEEMGEGDKKADDINTEISNIFYIAEDDRRDKPKDAYTGFLQVIAKSQGKLSELTDEVKTNVFKSLQYASTLGLQLNKSSDALSSYKSLLAFIPNVTRNEASEAIDAVLVAAAELGGIKQYQEFFDITAKALKNTSDSEKMLFDKQLKLGKMYIKQKMYNVALEVLKQLHKSCQLKDGTDDQKKGSELLEIYAMQVEIYTATGDAIGMKDIFERTKGLSAAVKDSHSQSIIRECWALMYADEGQWSAAKESFYTAFTSYDEVSNRPKAVQCFRNVVLSNMLMGSDTNPFDAQEVKSFSNEKEIKIVAELRSAFEKCDVDVFMIKYEIAIKQADPFFIKHKDALLAEFQSRVILSLVRSYRRIKILHLARALTVDSSKVEETLVRLILDGTLDARIDQVKGVVDLSQRSSGGKFNKLTAWSNTLNHIVSTLSQPSASSSSSREMDL
eukprot:TRINITY_DN2862_c0_g1_i2.p1 TRINITY_DN2862_c0_g1~~TRINITY_DN2862_c0_g1_i2.p1  ORF type:complete len:506 (-),score=87.20 TRINITY_DN2862_c0_g1_i2:331-1731(-)